MKVLERVNDIIRGKVGDPNPKNLRMAYTTAAEACRRESEDLNGSDYYGWITRGLNYIVDAHDEDLHDETLARTALELLSQTPRRVDAESQALGIAKLANFILDRGDILLLADQKKLSDLIARLLLRLSDEDPLTKKLRATKLRVEERVSSVGKLAESEVACEAQGVIHAFYPDRGFGFITITDGRQAYFHETSLIDIEPNNSVQKHVSFELLPPLADAKHPRAMAVRELAHP